MVAGFNFLVNPLAEYNTQLVSPLIPTTRREKVDYLQRATAAPEGIVLGSSRVMKFEPRYLYEVTGTNFYNAGVNYADPYDYLAIVRFYRRRYGRAPATIVLGLDVPSFSDAVDTDLRLGSTPELFREVADDLAMQYRLRPYRDAISWDQTKQSLRSLVFQVRPSSRPHSLVHFTDDGVLVYEDREQQLHDGTFDITPHLDYTKSEYEQRVRGFSELSKRKLDLLRKFFKSCETDRVEVHVFITTLHPQLADHLSTTTSYNERRAELCCVLDECQREFGFHWRDFSDIESYCGDQRDFVDGVHPLEPNTRKMIDTLWESCRQDHGGGSALQ